MADSSTRSETRLQQREPPAQDSGSRPSPTLAWGLGQREREVLSVLWSQGSANVQQVAERLSTVLAYTTVMTTLDRLFKKGLLQREKKDRAFIYSLISPPGRSKSSALPT